MIRERSERKKIFVPPTFPNVGVQASKSQFWIHWNLLSGCCISWAYIMQISKRYNFTFQQWQVKLDGCIVLNGRNAVLARIDPLYATVSLGPPESWTHMLSRSLPNFLQGSLGDTPTDRPTDHAIRSFTIGGIYLRIKGKEGRVFT